MRMQWGPGPSLRGRGAAYLNVDEREGNQLTRAMFIYSKTLLSDRLD
jgi:hypothetical protein